MTAPAPNSRDVAQTTAGISRNMQLGLAGIVPATAAGPQGGGDLNGTQAFILFQQSGTSGAQWSIPRLPMGDANYTGVV